VITKKDQIEHFIMQSNEKKFHQTEGHGQLQKGILLADVGTMGTGPQTAGILAGTYIPLGVLIEQPNNSCT
jgi:hypothetical protein